ncbi:MAG: hypothetical protein KAJ63_04545, partial [Methyloprofundus sp.]|nr:hypothetical protein [Methyloprofundus sp.]
KIKLFRLTLAKWQKHFNYSIQSAPDGIEWPILKRTQCHCGVWIRRAQHEQLFDDKSLKNLKKEHNIMHDIADDLFEKCQQGKIDAAKAGLKGFLLSVEGLSHVLGECEQEMEK